MFYFVVPKVGEGKGGGQIDGVKDWCTWAPTTFRTGLHRSAIP